MFTAQPDRGEVLKRAVLAALVEAAGAISRIGPFLKAANAFREEWVKATGDLPAEARDIVRKMAGDFRTFLNSEVPPQTVGVALEEAFAILNAHGLSSAELVTEARLDATQAAQRTLERAEADLRLLDADTEALVRRLVEEYYRVLLSHRDALARLGVPAFRELLTRMQELMDRFEDLVQAEKRKAWDALRPVEEHVSPPPGGPLQLAELKAPNRLVPFTGQAHERLRDKLAAWAEGVANHPYRADLRLVYGPGGAGKSRLGVEVGLALMSKGWQAYFLPTDAGAFQEYAVVWARPSRPTLLILDYAEHFAAQAETLLQAVANASGLRKHPLALLFLLRPDPRDEKQPLHPMLRGLAMRPPTQAAFWNQVCRLALENARLVPLLTSDDGPALFETARNTFRARVAAPPAGGGNLRR